MKLKSLLSETLEKGMKVPCKECGYVEAVKTGEGTIDCPHCSGKRKFVGEDTSNDTYDAKFIGWQSGTGNIPAFPMYDITKVGHPQYQSTVSDKTLDKLGLKYLPPPPFKKKELESTIKSSESESIIGKKVSIETYVNGKVVGEKGTVIKQLFNGQYVIKLKNGQTVNREEDEIEPISNLTEEESLLLKDVRVEMECGEYVNGKVIKCLLNGQYAVRLKNGKIVKKEREEIGLI